MHLKRGAAKSVYDRVAYIERDVVCSTNLTGQQYGVEPWDFVDVVCSVEFRGYWMPDVSCAPELSGFAENASSSRRVTYRRVIAAADVRNGTSIACRTTFVQLEWKDESALRTTPLPDAPRYDHVWTSPPIHVVSNITGSFIATLYFAYCGMHAEYKV